MRDSLVDCAMLTIVSFLCRSLAKPHDTVMGGLLVIVSRISSLRFQSFFSVLSSEFMVFKKTDSSCALHVDSRFTSIGFVGNSSPSLRTVILLGSSFNQAKKFVSVIIFPAESGVVKMNCNTKTKAFHAC